MKRKALKYFKEWAGIEDSVRGVLLVRGVRQCGKTFAINEFLASEFSDSFVSFDFEKDENLQYAVKECKTLAEILDQLSIHSRRDIKKSSRLAIFFDEIQAVPNLIRHLRYFKEDYPSLHVTAAGSYLEFALKEVGSFPVGRINHYFMKPMDFEEFLWGKNLTGASDILSSLRSQFDTNQIEKTCQRYQTKLKQFHDQLIKHAFEYELCGGMPAAVSTFINTFDLEKVRDVQNDILTSYRDDIQKYVKQGLITNTVRMNVDAVLGKIQYLSRKVVYKKISKSHSETIKKAIDLLENVGLVYKVFYSNAFDSPLSAGKNERDYRLFLCDTGMFHALMNSEVPKVISPDIHYSNDGVLGEYFLITELIKRSSPKRKQHDVYFWENKNKSAGAEIDALVFLQNCLCAIDAKRKKPKISPSLKSFHRRWENHDSLAKPMLLSIVSSIAPISRLNGNFINMPFYLTPFL